MIVHVARVCVWVFSTVYITSTVVLFFAVTICTLLPSNSYITVTSARGQTTWALKDCRDAHLERNNVPCYRRDLSAANSNFMRPRKKKLLGRSPKTAVLPSARSIQALTVVQPGAAASEVCGEAKAQTRTRGICFSHVHPSVAEGPCTAPAHPPTRDHCSGDGRASSSRQVIHW